MNISLLIAGVALGLFLSQTESPGATNQPATSPQAAESTEQQPAEQQTVSTADAPAPGVPTQVPQPAPATTPIPFTPTPQPEAATQQAPKAAPQPAPIQKRVALQVGHWKNNEFPYELRKLSHNTGASAAGVQEWQINLKVAEATAELLRTRGMTVDILPATVPVDYTADAFIAIHADGAVREGASGYKVAPSAFDRTGEATMLSSAILKTYGEKTGLRLDQNNITSGMTRYYAFNYPYFDHAIHPNTPGVIVELGFLTNYGDRDLLLNRTEAAAQGIANGIIQYFS